MGAHLLGSLGLPADTMLLVFAATAPPFRLEAGLRISWRIALIWMFTSYDTFLALCVLVVLGYGLLAQLRRTRRLEQAHVAVMLHNAALQSQLSEARLLALRMQLNPHLKPGPSTICSNPTTGPVSGRLWGAPCSNSPDTALVIM